MSSILFISLCPSLEEGSASEMTYIVSSGALNSTHSLTLEEGNERRKDGND